MKPLAWLMMSLLVVLVDASSSDKTQSICQPFGECEPCPSDALHEPFCQPFGNRRLMHCSLDQMNESTPGETPAWQSCGRVVAQERADFYEFVACNLFFGGAALAVALVRSRRVEARQARRLAARIGLGRER